MAEFDSRLNPFASGSVPPQWVIGRDEELALLHDSLRHGLLGVVIRGTRGIGKTALIERFRMDCPDAQMVYMDIRDYLSASEVRNEAAVRHNLARAIVEELNFAGLLPTHIHPDDVSEGSFFREVLTAICRPNAPRLVVALDELDFLDASAIRSVWRGFFRARNLAVPPLFVGIVGESWTGSGSEALLEADERVRHIRLGPLRRQDIAVLLARHSQQGLFAFSEEAAEAVWTETGGFPLFVVYLLDAVHQQRAISTRAGSVTANEVHEAAESCGRQMPKRVVHALAQAGPASQRILVSLVEHQALTHQELLQVVETDWKASAEEVTASLQGLISAKLVKDESGVLQVSIPLLAGWIKQLTTEDVEAAECPPRADAFIAFREAEALDYKGNREEAIEKLKIAVSLDKRYWRARWLLARLLIAQSEASKEKSSVIHAEDYLRELRNEVPWRGSILADVERHLCILLVKRLSDPAVDYEQRQQLCAEILKLDPSLSVPNAREQIAAQEVEQWARRLDRLPPERWLEATRRVLRHDRCWQNAADRLTAWLTGILQDPIVDRAQGLLQGVLVPLLEIEAPKDSTPRFWPQIIKLLEAMSHRLPLETSFIQALSWEAILTSVPEIRLDEILAASNALIRADLLAAVRRGEGGETGRLVVLLRDLKASDILAASLDNIGELVLQAMESPEVRGNLNESLGPYLAPLVTAGVRMPASSMIAAGAHEIAALFFEVCPMEEAGIVVSQNALDAWQAVQRGIPELEPAAEFVRQLRSLASQGLPALQINPAEREDLEKLLNDEFKIEERVSIRVPGLWTPLADDSVRAYRACRTGQEQKYFQVRVFSLRGDNVDMLGVLRTIWEKERRALSALSVSPSGRALTRFVEARYDKESDRAVLVIEWPGEVTLRERLGRERTGLLQPSRRKRLWGHLAALLESIQALHNAGFIHRAISPDVVYVQGQENEQDPQLSPLFKLGHFEWSVYLRGLTSMVSPISRELNRYIAPEALRATLGTEIERGMAGESFGSDLYAMGLLLFETLVRPFTKTELGYYRSRESYDEAEEQRHRHWIKGLRDEIAELRSRQNEAYLSLDLREAEILLGLIHFDLPLRPRHLEDIIIKAREVAIEDLEIAAPVYAATTLSSKPGIGDPRMDPRCIAYFLRSYLPEIDIAENPLSELEPNRLAQVIGAEIGAATVHLNSNPKEFPLILRSRSGVLFRVQPVEWGGQIHRNIAYLEVARPDDHPLEIPIGKLRGGVKLVDVKENEVHRLIRDFRETSYGSWEPLFQVAEKSHETIETQAGADEERQKFSDVLSLMVRLEYEAMSEEIDYRIVSSDFEKAVLRAKQDEKDIAGMLAHASAEDPRFEIARRRTPIGQGVKVVIDESALDIESGTVAVSLNGTQIPAEGVIRPLSIIGAEIQYGRRRRILHQVKDDEFLLDHLISPSGKSSGDHFPSRGYDTIIKDLDEDKRRIAAQFFQVEPLVVVQGPPATGKTTLASEIVLRILERNPHGRILVTTQGHEPLDNLLERILNESRTTPRAKKILGDLEIVRIPSGWRPRDDSQASAFYPHVRAEEMFKRLREWCTREMGSLGLIGEVARAVNTQLGGYLSAPNSLRRRIQDGANLVFATVNSKLIDTTRPGSYDLVVVEEAGRCYPIEIAGAMRLARRWLLIGDHKQLEPFAFTTIGEAFESYIALEAQTIEKQDENVREKKRAWIKNVRKAFYPYLYLLRHLHESEGVHAATLRTQWRMHPTLGKMVSEIFYDGRAVCNPEDPDAYAALTVRRTHQFTAPKWIRGRQLIWIDMDHAEHSPECSEYRGPGGLIENHAERRTLVACLRELRTPRASKDIALLTPYRYQAEQLIGLLRKDVNRFEAFGDLGKNVFTIDAFQGRQASTVVLSLVRNNNERTERAALGFLAKRERATVMFSRAERLLIVIGCSEHFNRFASQGAGWIADIVNRAEVIHFRQILSLTEIAKLVERYGYRS